MSDVRKLRKQLDAALAKRKDDDAIAALRGLCEADPKAPRWPHKLGELYHKAGKRVSAVEQYTNAANLYAEQGFIARAIAMAKTILELDSTKIDVLERIDPESARRMHRKQRPQSLSGPVKAHPALLPDDDLPAHPALLPETSAAASSGARAPARRHPALIPESEPLDVPERPAPARAAPAASASSAKRPAPAGPPVLGISDVLGGTLGALPAPPKMPDLAGSVLDLADELTIAPDVAATETRFSNAPPSGRIRVDMTVAELTPRRAASVELRSAPPPPQSAAALSKLPLFPLFAEMPKQVLVELVKASTVVELGDGERVVRAGEPADALFGIVEGSVELAVPGQQLSMTLAEGDVFGESCLLPGEMRRAEAMVRGKLVAIRLGREVLSQVIALYPPMAEVLLDLLTRRLLSNLLQSAALFQELDARGRQHMAQLFEVRRAPRGTQLAVAGKRMDGLYVTLTGRVLVTGQDGQSEEHDAGTMFGQSSLLMSQVSDATISTQANMLVLRLPAQAFHSAVMQYPGMLALLSELAGSTIAKVAT